jgi:hypothetical protein
MGRMQAAAKWDDGFGSDMGDLPDDGDGIKRNGNDTARHEWSVLSPIKMDDCSLPGDRFEQTVSCLF